MLHWHSGPVLVYAQGALWELQVLEHIQAEISRDFRGVHCTRSPWNWGWGCSLDQRLNRLPQWGATKTGVKARLRTLRAHVDEDPTDFFVLPSVIPCFVHGVARSMHSFPRADSFGFLAAKFGPNFLGSVPVSPEAFSDLGCHFAAARFAFRVTHLIIWLLNVTLRRTFDGRFYQSMINYFMTGQPPPPLTYPWEWGIRPFSGLLAIGFP